jgi:hypothetical protein
MQNIFCSNMFVVRTRLVARWSGVGDIFSPDLARKELSGMCYGGFEAVETYPKRSWATRAIRIVPS